MKFLKPKFHVVVPHYHPASENHKWAEWLQDMENSLPKDCCLFTGLSSLELLSKTSRFSGRSFYVDTRYSPLALDSAPCDLSKKILEVRTVLVQCLTIAIYMAFERVYLVGFDLDQICNKNNMGRFYGLSKITDTESEKRIDAEVSKTAQRWFHWWNMNLAFDLLKVSAQKNGTQILNVTGGGMLDTFDRMNYLDLFDGSKKAAGT